MRKHPSPNPLPFLPSCAAAGRAHASAAGLLDASVPVAPAKAAERGLLRLCEEIAGTLLRRRLEGGDPVEVVRRMRRDLVLHLPDCDDSRAGRLVDLALELLHVKAHGRYRRNALELGELIAEAGRRLRDRRDN